MIINDIKSILPKFIEFVYADKVQPRFNWAKFVDNWCDVKCVHVMYEGLLTDVKSELKRIVLDLSREKISDQRVTDIVEKYSFERQSGRIAGDEKQDQFIRKGVQGDWKNHYTKEAKETFAVYAGDASIKLGYESDYSWTLKL